MLNKSKNGRIFFPDSQLLFLKFEDFYVDNQATFDKVCDFLGVPRLNLKDEKNTNKEKRESRSAKKEEEDEEKKEKEKEKREVPNVPRQNWSRTS